MSESSALEAARAKLARPVRVRWSLKAALAASTLAAASALLLAAAVILGPGVHVVRSDDATVFAR
ncbi:hypothetical protein [Caulobacter sp. 17J80-11]|uniref:hypothetical protein n=1 Tax=Caulobacter sp. 17J80-11 TaxID=2763502 RepID=UPI001653696A|nr:hypothetical protein [Caulobacter sp. 17J80-11]MBC6980779.1 hypothetical protein [Caulobacter sp. 17J80-11]